MAQEPVIKVHDLVVSFGDQIVLDHLSLEVRGGEILGVVGASGSGKSVLLRTIIGLLPKRHGSIEVLGVDLDKANELERRALERRWGVLFQQGALFSSLTVRQNVQFPCAKISACRQGCLTKWRWPSWKWSGSRVGTPTSFPPSCQAA